MHVSVDWHSGVSQVAPRNAAATRMAERAAMVFRAGVLVV